MNNFVLTSFDDVLTRVRQSTEKRVMAVAAAADQQVLLSVQEAKRASIAQPILVGDRGKIANILHEIGENPSDYFIEHIPGEPAKAAEAAVELIKRGEANFLMKGMIETTDLLRPVVKKENGLRTGRTMSHLAFNALPSYHKLIINTDGGMCPYPDLQKKREILLNALDTLRVLGYHCPKAACPCCKETVDEKMPETVDARVLQNEADAGNFGRCVVEGPVSYDIAMSPKIAEEKRFNSPNCGDFDVLLQPNIHAGNIMGKTWLVSCGATLAGIVAGARIPIVLTSRGSSAQEKYFSIALAALVAVHNGR